MCFFYFLIFQIMSGLTSRAGERGRRRGARAKATTTQVPCAGCARDASLSKRKCIEHTRSAWERNLLLKIGVGTLSAYNMMTHSTVHEGYATHISGVTIYCSLHSCNQEDITRRWPSGTCSFGWIGTHMSEESQHEPGIF